MMFHIVGSHLCPNTIYAITKCKDAGIPFGFKDLSASLKDLKYFLALHEHDGIYDPYRNMSGKEDYEENGKIGLPCFVFEDGFKTLDLSEAMKKAKESMEERQMKYNFETVHKRFHTGSKKWDELSANGVGEKEDIIPFSVADMEFVTAPEIVDAIKDELDHSIMGYANPTKEYLDTVCRWMKERHGWDAKPEWILPAHGIIDAFFDAVKIYTKEGEGVMLMTPVYYPMYHAVNYNNRVLVDCALVEKGNSYQIDFEDFERKASDENTKMLILCSPHNPCGRVWTREELEKIGEICLKHRVLVVSDEIHFDLIMPGHKHIVFASLSEEIADNCIVCTAPSKTFNLAGLQTSNIFIPNPDLRDKFFQALKRCNPNPKCNILGYRACEAAYKHCGQWLEEAISVIDTNRKLVTDFMAKEFPQIKVKELEATYLLWMDWRGLGIDSKELERINHEEARLFFDEGYVFGAQGDGFERWNLACPTRYVEKALERMKKTYKKYVK